MPDPRQTSRLLYLDASDINDDRVDFEDLDLLDTAGEKLGDVEGFIVHRDTGRPYYVVIDSGGWFSSRSFLVPIGHVRLDPGKETLRSDLGRSVIQRFPEYDENRFEQMSEDEARLFNERTLTACCATELQARAGADRYDYDKWSHYAQPDWWRSTWFTAAPPGMSTSRTDRTTPLGAGGAVRDVAASSAAMPRERVTARDRDVDDADIDAERTGVGRARGEDRVVDPLDRAQPGDILGIERDGEVTRLGDTAHDERERLEDVEEDVADLRRDELKRKDRR
jgi:hypothetical protein